MAQIKLSDNTIVNLSGNLPAVGSEAPDFVLSGTDLKDVRLKDFRGKNVVMNIFPSIDTRVCPISVKEFNKLAAAITNTVVLSISKDLPYAHKRFCAAEGVNNVVMLSEFKDNAFSDDYGILMKDGHMAGLHARAIVVVDPTGTISHTELVPVIGQEPNYQAALAALR
jgi:thioredoxin-dependent peroxiredoxin